MKKINPIDFCEHTIVFKHYIETQYLEFAAQLKNIRDDKLYAGRWESFEDFLADPTMAMDKGTASKMISIHERFVLEYKIPTQKIAQVGGWSKVAEILPVIKDKKSAIKWLEQAASLSQSDLRKEIKEEKTGIKMSECEHKDFYLVKICRKCGDRIQDHSHD